MPYTALYNDAKISRDNLIPCNTSAPFKRGGADESKASTQYVWSESPRYSLDARWKETHEMFRVNFWWAKKVRSLFDQNRSLQMERILTAYLSMKTHLANPAQFSIPSVTFTRERMLIKYAVECPWNQHQECCDNTSHREAFHLAILAGRSGWIGNRLKFQARPYVELIYSGLCAIKTSDRCTTLQLVLIVPQSFQARPAYRLPHCPVAISTRGRNHDVKFNCAKLSPELPCVSVRDR